MDFDAPTFIIAFVAPQAGETSTYFQHVNSRGPLPDDDLNTGRAMRCLMMSYLC